MKNKTVRLNTNSIVENKGDEKVYKINELIGIIKGINFDCIINTKEVEHLQSWVDKNRSIACESNQLELIKLVDEVLVENIISKDEQELILLYSEELINNKNDAFYKIYELNGIIEGIICDDEVNEKEIYRLKKWMDDYGDSIREHKPSAAICSIVEDILADGIVTSIEQQKLLQMLSARINSSHFDTKLEYLKKLVRERKNIGIYLIEILDNDEAMDKIHRFAEVQLRTTLNSYSGSFVSDCEVVFISLVLIAMLKYDGNFYGNVQETYKDLYNLHSEQKIEGLIRTILNRYKTDEDTDTISSRSRIINVVLANAIVPNHFLEPFFEFIYDIYKLNFEYSLVEDLYGEFEFVYQGLQKNMGIENDEVELTVTKKTYKLIRSTKRLITNDKSMESVIKLSMIIIKIIDNTIWNKENRLYNPYLKAGYEGWISKLKDDVSERKNVRTLSDIRSRWEPKIILINNEIYIVPPIHKVKAEYDYRDIKIVVLNGGQELYKNNQPDLREIIGGYKIILDRIKITEPMGKITYKLMAGEVVIYDSREKLYRDVIVFDIEGNEIHNNSDYSGTAVFCYKNHNENMKEFYNNDCYKLSSQNVKVHDTFMIEKTIFNFSLLIKSGIFGDEYPNHCLLDTTTKEKIPVYKNVKVLFFECENSSSNFEIVIDGKAFSLNRFKYSITEREGIIKYAVDLEINDSGIHSILVYQLLKDKKNKLWSFNFVLDKGLEIDELKLDDKNYMVAIKTDLCKTTINLDINVDSFSENFLTIECNRKIYIYCIPFHFEFYRIEGLEWRPMKQALWIGDITQESVLNIYGAEVNEVTVYNCSGQILSEKIDIKNMGIYQQIRIGFLMSFKPSNNYVKLLLLKDGIRKQSIICYNRCVLDEKETELIFDPVTKKLNVTSVYNGKGDVFFEIIKTDGNKIYKSETLKNRSTVKLVNLKSFEKYQICFFEKEKDLSVKKEYLMKKYEKVFYAWDDFIGHSFKICKIYFDQLVRGQFLRKSYCFSKNYVTFLSKEADDKFSGELFARTYKGDYKLVVINPVSIEICSDVMSDKMELSITKDGDGLFWDFENHDIKNTLDDITATDIFSYIIDMKEVE